MNGARFGMAHSAHPIDCNCEDECLCPLAGQGITDDEFDAVVSLARSLVPEAAIDNLCDLVLDEVRRVREIAVEVAA